MRAVGAVEAFGEDYEVRAGAAGFVNLGPRMGEVFGFVGTSGELDQGELEGFFERGGRHCRGPVAVVIGITMGPSRFRAEPAVENADCLI